MQRIHGDGGMVNNAFLMQFVADICGVEVDASTVPELSALGAARAGELGLGVYANIEALSALPLPCIHYAPQANETLVEDWYQGWLAAVQRVL